MIGDNNQPVRDAWIEKALLSFPAKLSILDAGAGEMPYKKFCSHLRYTSQDSCIYDGHGEIGLHTGEWDKSKIDIISDITTIPVTDGSFDIILCTEVLEHLPYPIKAIKEFSRILKKGGILIVTTPFNSIVHQAPYYFYSGFSSFFYEKIFASNGFKIDEMIANGNYFDVLAQELRRIPSVMSKYHMPKNGSLNMYVDKVLNIMEKLPENESSQLACFGYIVKAYKR